jgi:hypothetical protein
MAPPVATAALDTKSFRLVHRKPSSVSFVMK